MEYTIEMNGTKCTWTNTKDGCLRTLANWRRQDRQSGIKKVYKIVLA